MVAKTSTSMIGVDFYLLFSADFASLCMSFCPKILCFSAVTDKWQKTEAEFTRH